MTTTHPPMKTGTAAGAIAAVLHLGIAVFPLSASGLLAPLWAIIAIYVGWALAGFAMYRIWRQRPWLAVAVPPATLALWFGFVTFGERALGWTA